MESAGLFWVLLNSARFCWALLDSAGLYWVLLGSAVFCWATRVLFCFLEPRFKEYPKPGT